MVRTHNYNSAFSLINLIPFVCVPMTRVIAFAVHECFKQVCPPQVSASESSWFI